MDEMNILVVHPAERPAEVVARLESKRPWTRIAPGAIVRVRGLRLRVTEIAMAIETDGCGATRTVLHALAVRDNVVTMPFGGGSPIADLYRYHAFVERFDCDPDAWLAHLQARGRGASGDARFARWIRERMRRDPRFIDEIRLFVAATQTTLSPAS